MFQKIRHSGTCNQVKSCTKHGRPDQSQRENAVASGHRSQDPGVIRAQLGCSASSRYSRYPADFISVRDISLKELTVLRKSQKTRFLPLFVRNGLKIDKNSKN